MNFLSETKFKHLFGEQPPINISSFLNKAQVRTGGNGSLEPLKTYIKKHEISKQDIAHLFAQVSLNNREQYLSRYYQKSLTPNLPLDIVEQPMTIFSMNNNTQAKYKNIIRNMYYQEILRDTQPGLPNLRSFWGVLDDLYNHCIIDYKLLTPSSRFYIRQGRIGSVFSSYYFRASIMNPYLVYSLNHKVLKGSRIFTPTLGWTSYCYGFMECPMVTEYVGTDVIPKVCRRTKQFAQTYYPKKSAEIYCCPSEDLLKNPVFMRRYRGYFDVVFFSPPYYRLELYPGTTQSTSRYNTYEEWLEGYWANTIRLCSHLLAKGGRLCYIVGNYGKEDDQINLIKDLKQIAIDVGNFEYKRMIKMSNKTVVVNKGQDDNSESICIFTK